MAKVIVCDRCHEEIVEGTYFTFYNETYEICELCADKLEDWIDNIEGVVET